MNFLLDTNILSYYLKGNRALQSRFLQYQSGLATSTICVAELYAGASRRNVSPSLLIAIDEVLLDIVLLDFDYATARTFGQLNAELLDAGRPTPVSDVLIAATALTHDLTLITHNTKDFAHIPGLRLEDWMV